MQRNLIQTKVQEKIPERGLRETEITNVLEKYFKMKVINILMDLQKRSQGGLQQKEI